MVLVTAGEEEAKLARAGSSARSVNRALSKSKVCARASAAAAACPHVRVLCACVCVCMCVYVRVVSLLGCDPWSFFVCARARACVRVLAAIALLRACVICAGMRA